MFHVAVSFMKIAYRTSFSIFWDWLVSLYCCGQHEVLQKSSCIFNIFFFMVSVFLDGDS